MTIILGLSLALNLFQAVRINGLNTSARSGTKLPPPIQAGTIVSPFKAQGLRGEQGLVSYQNIRHPIVLYVFTPTCVWCSRNLANFQTLIAQKHDSYDFVGLSLSGDGLSEYVAKNKLDIPVYFNPAEETKLEYRLSSTHQTIVISTEGKVLQNWLGAYSGAQQSEVEKFFDVKLPGLAAESNEAAK
jgi:hypothetical protein